MTRTCETCNDTGTVIEFHRFAGEAYAGEPYEIPCPDCDGEDDGEPGVPFDYAAHIRELLAERDRRLTEQVDRELRRTIEIQRKDAA